MAITFVKRSELKPGEVTIRIHNDAGAVLGEVTCPGGLAGSHTAAEADNETLGVHQALASAIAMAGKYGNRIGVIDEEALWRPEWGDLLEN